MVNLNAQKKRQKKYIAFPVPIKKELDNCKIITYKLKFIDTFRFMSTSLPKLAKYLSEKLHSDKYTDCKSKLDYLLKMIN